MNNELYHHGILGQHWGIRRFQRKDGSLTSAGKKRYDDDQSDSPEKKQVNKQNVRAAALIAGGATLAAVSAFVISHNCKTKSMSVIAEMSSKRGAEIRQNAQRGLDYMNRLRAQQQSAMNAANKAFDALNRR